MLSHSRQRGDTIIEVILAFAVFAMLAVGTIILMNRGTQASQQALESTLTQETLAGQSESLLYLREAYIANPSTPAPSPAATFKDIINNRTVSSPSPFGDSSCVSSIPAGSFAIDPMAARVISASAMNGAAAPAYPQILTSGGVTRAYGVWIEAVKPTPISGQPSFIDFHIRACWYSPIGAVPTTTGTILRQYIPG